MSYYKHDVLNQMPEVHQVVKAECVYDPFDRDPTDCVARYLGDDQWEVIFPGLAIQMICPTNKDREVYAQQVTRWSPISFSKRDGDK